MQLSKLQNNKHTLSLCVVPEYVSKDPYNFVGGQFALGKIRQVTRQVLPDSLLHIDSSQLFLY